MKEKAFVGFARMVAWVGDFVEHWHLGGAYFGIQELDIWDGRQLQDLPGCI